MEKIGKSGVDNLSIVGALLREIEVEHVDNSDGSALHARQELVEILDHYLSSRFSFGKALAAYKVFFIKEGGWVAAAKVIGKAIHRDAKTIYRIVDDYARASKLPNVAIVELEAQGIDPAAKKNEPIVEAITLMARAEIESAPKEAVVTGIDMANHAKAAERAKNAENKHAVHVTKAAKEPSQSIPVRWQHGRRIPPFTPEEQRRDHLKRAIYGELCDLPNGKQLSELIASIEEFMYENLDLKEAISIRFNPHPSEDYLAELRENAAEQEDAA
jgi:hypothetical protein